MLHTEILTKETLALLKTLMQDDRLSDFNLVGDTGLFLYLGHRKSIDLELYDFAKRRGIVFVFPALAKRR